MYVFYDARQKNSNLSSAYKTLFVFFGRMLLIIGITVVAMLISISQSSAQAQNDHSYSPGKTVVPASETDKPSEAITKAAGKALSGVYSFLKGS